ncbi:MAG: hypothetical protein GF346_12010 [Candidatus Eisenbacteria bacterium]|nr:hypothetical protein [Candidatus Latescibacterota bacterium]MBD3303161.1 hypothetical protein [Candidatus Eisenbacteria bacterium]
MKKLAIIAWVLVLSTPAATGLAAAEETSAAEGPLTYECGDGILEVRLPEGWEANPRLASDNMVLAFFHPAGMELDQEIPIWIFVEERSRPGGSSFETWMEEVLDEGAVHDFVVQDSARFETAGGSALYDYRFNASVQGEIRGITFLETPEGALLFRRQADGRGSWEEWGDEALSLVSGVRFVAR